MASVRFYLRSKQTNPAAIIGKLSYSGEKYIFSTGYSVNPKNWNQEKQLVTQKERAADDINTFLTNKKAEILKIHDDLRRENSLNNEEIERRVKGEKTGETTLYEHFEKVIEEIKIKELRNIKEGKQKKKHLYSRYQKCYERLKEFAGNKVLGFSDII